MMCYQYDFRTSICLFYMQNENKRSSDIHMYYNKITRIKSTLHIYRFLRILILVENSKEVVFNNKNTLKGEKR